MIETIQMGQTYDALPVGAVRTLEGADRIVVQTVLNGCASHIAENFDRVTTLDPIFEHAQDFDELYALGAEQILEQVPPDGTLAFCFLGGASENGFVEALRRLGADMEHAGGTDPAAEALQIAGLAPASYASVDARNLDEAYLDTSQLLLVTGVDDRYTAAAAKSVLTDFYGDEVQATVVAGGRSARMPLHRMDTVEDWKDGGVLILPGLPLVEKTRFTYPDLRKVMRILRAPDGCPWDREQTHASLRPYLIEESYEVSDAVRKGDIPALYDELGDVLLQVVFHSEIGRLAGEFTDMDVTTAECEKMIRRHPHVFAEGKADTPAAVLKAWDKIKKEEKGTDTAVQSLMDVPESMSPLMRAAKLQKRAADVGFDWPGLQGAAGKLREELEELEEEVRTGNDARRMDEAGDVLFSAVNVVRLAGVSPETALQDACAKFVRRFRHMEEHTQTKLEELTLDEMDDLWREAKRAEPGPESD